VAALARKDGAHAPLNLPALVLAGKGWRDFRAARPRSALARSEPWPLTARPIMRAMIEPTDSNSEPREAGAPSLLFFVLVAGLIILDLFVGFFRLDD
jgi:hypothetical protein